MDRFRISLLILFFTVTGCYPHAGRHQFELPWTVRVLTDKSIDLPYEAVSVMETGRYTPPDGFTWPESFGVRGQTVVGLKEDGLHLYSASLADEDNPARAMDWNLSENSIDPIVLDPQPPENTWNPIPFRLDRESPGTETIPGFVYVSPNGESTIRAVSIDDGDPLPLAIIDRIFIIDPWFDLDETVKTSNFLSYDVHQLELSATSPLPIAPTGVRRN